MSDLTTKLAAKLALEYEKARMKGMRMSALIIIGVFVAAIALAQYFWGTSHE